MDHGHGERSASKPRNTHSDTSVRQQACQQTCLDIFRNQMIPTQQGGISEKTAQACNARPGFSRKCCVLPKPPRSGNPQGDRRVHGLGLYQTGLPFPGLRSRNTFCGSETPHPRRVLALALRVTITGHPLLGALFCNSIEIPRLGDSLGMTKIKNVKYYF